MIITLAEIERQFDKWNDTIFGGELPRPTFELIQTKRHLGQFHWRKIGTDKMGYSIRISVFYDRPLEAYVDTIVHEMLHFYIKYNGIKDTSSHGRIWKAKVLVPFYSHLFLPSNRGSVLNRLHHQSHVQASVR